jgi:hypothetical protein
MISSQLLNSTFKRICDFIEKSGFKTRNTSFGIALYYDKNIKVNYHLWVWVNKKELLLGSNINGHSHVYSLFSSIIARYEYFKKFNIKNAEPLTEPISENTLNFINVCRFLNDCNSIEELTIKMDLMGI